MASAVLPTDPQARKSRPLTTGVLDYFPAALAEVALVSKAGNDQHNPGQPLHWARGKSMDHADCITRHLMDRGTLDSDGQLHSAKLAWRALALLQEELEARGAPMSRGSWEPERDAGCRTAAPLTYEECIRLGRATDPARYVAIPQADGSAY